MLDDHKYSSGRLVVYEHTDPQMPRQSYGQFGHAKTVGEVVSVELSAAPLIQWVYTIKNIRNQEMTRIEEDKIKFATDFGTRASKYASAYGQRLVDSQIVELISKVLYTPAEESILRAALRKFLQRSVRTSRSRESQDAALEQGDYVRLRGDLRPESESVNNHYAKVVEVAAADIAGIENPKPQPGQPTLYRVRRKYKVLTSEKTTLDIYDAEIKTRYTSHGRKVILNWRATMMLSEVFNDPSPYNLELEFLDGHVFTRDELQLKKRQELVFLISSLLYVKGKMGWKEYHSHKQLFLGVPKNHLVDNVLEISRFDSCRNRMMTSEEIQDHQQKADKFRRLLGES